MLKNMNLTNVAAACHGELHNCSNPDEVYINGAVIDSRQVEDGYLFVAVKGERVDGHDFVVDLLNGPAACALVEVAPQNCDKPYIVVPSTLVALKEIAAFYRQQLDIKVVGITGSVGKTSTKEMIASVLAQKYNVLKTEGNFNNEIGLPLTIMRIRDEHEVAAIIFCPTTPPGGQPARCVLNFFFAATAKSSKIAPQKAKKILFSSRFRGLASLFFANISVYYCYCVI